MERAAPLTALWRLLASTWLAGALLVAPGPARAQTGIDSLDALDAEFAEGDGGSSAGPRLAEFRGFVAQELRSFPLDRGVKNDEQLLTEVQVDLDLKLAGRLHARLVPWFLIDALDTDLLRYEPLEAYLSYQGGTWDVLAGQFIDNLGIADTFNPLDVLNRRDYATDIIDPQRRGELGARARWQLPGGSVIGEPTFSLYALPLFRETDFPTQRQHSSFSSDALVFDEELAQGPAGLDRATGAVRFESTVNAGAFNADAQFLVVRGPSATPGLIVVPLPGGSFAVTPEYHGEWVFGGGLRAVPAAPGWSKLTLKAELAFKKPYDFMGYSGPDVGSEHGPPGEYFQYVVGVDRSFPGVLSDRDQLVITIEYAGERGPSDDAGRLRPFDSDAGTRIAWNAGDFSSTKFEARGVVDVTNGEVIAEGLASRQLRFIHEDLKLEVGARYIHRAPGEATMLASLPLDNSRFHARLQFDF